MQMEDLVKYLLYNKLIYLTSRLSEGHSDVPILIDS